MAITLKVYQTTNPEGGKVMIQLLYDKKYEFSVHLYEYTKPSASIDKTSGYDNLASANRLFNRLMKKHTYDRIERTLYTTKHYDMAVDKSFGID